MKHVPLLQSRVFSFVLEQCKVDGVAFESVEIGVFIDQSVGNRVTSQ